MKIIFAADYDNYTNMTRADAMAKYGLYYRIIYTIEFGDIVLDDSMTISICTEYQDENNEYSISEEVKKIFLDDYWSLVLQAFETTYGIFHIKNLNDNGQYMTFADIHKPIMITDENTVIYDGEVYEYKETPEYNNTDVCEMCDLKNYCANPITEYLSALCGDEHNNGIYLKRIKEDEI